MSLKTDLLDARAYGALAPSRVVLAETHISWVFVLDHDVFKVKKPVDLGFLDFRTIEARKLACEAEARLNRRLAPDVYRGVVPVRRGADGRCRIGGHGSIVDWAVHMVRLPDERRADELLARGELTRDSIAAVATRVAAFHAAAPASAEATAFGAPSVVRANVAENFAQTRDVALRYLEPAQAAEIGRASCRERVFITV